MFKKIIKNEYFYDSLFLLIFFVFESYVRNEFFLTALIIIFGIFIFLFPKERKVKIWLWVIGTILGFVIEVGMGLISRSQYWNYGILFGVPLWLPFAWGVGFEGIYLLGRFIKSKIK